MKRATCSILFVMVSCFLGACAYVQKPESEIGEAGSIIARAEWTGEVPGEVVLIRMSVSGSEMKTISREFGFSGKKGEIHGIHGVVAGSNRTVVLEGLDMENEKIYEGFLSKIEVIPGQITDCGSIMMKTVEDMALAAPSADVEPGNGKATIRWSNVPGAESYNIYLNRSPGASKKNFDARKATGSTSYEWTGLNNGTTYYFVVTAENRDGESRDSTEINATPQKVVGVSKAANPPNNVLVKAGNNKVTITWDGVKEADSYNIYMNRARGVSKKNFDARKNTGSKSYEWEGLENETTYYFVITTENRYGESAESKEVEATPKGTVEGRVLEEEPSQAALVAASKPPVASAVPPPEAPAAVPEVPTKLDSKATLQEKEKQSKVAVVASKPPVASPVPPPEAPAAVPEVPTKLDSKAALQKADEIRAPKQSFTVDIKMTSKKGDKETSNEVTLRVRDFNKSLVIYRYPLLQKGRVLLMVESNMWIYFPGTKRSIRISPQQQMLGQVSNADVARVVFSLDYEAESVEEEVVENEQHLKLSLKAKTEGAAYGSIKLYMKKQDFKLTKAEFFTPTGRLLKIIYYKEYKEILGMERPTVHEIHDAINKSEISIMEYSNWRIEETPEEYFQKTFMQRVAGLLR